MMTKEEYKKELVRMWDSVRDDKSKGRNNCEGVICSECQFCDINDNDNDCYEPINAVEMVEAVEKWSKEHPPKKFKVSKLEYDIMRATIKYSSNDDSFYDVDILFDLIQKGYFKGACGNMFIHYYFDRCEVA